MEVQKETYLNVILPNQYSEDSFVTKSITLDFLFGFNSPYSAFVTLNECLNENNRLAKMGLNCIYGILLAVKEYSKFCKTAISEGLISTLINVITYKIDDFNTKNYKDCMIKILEFISDNVDFKMITSFFQLANTFLYCEGVNEDREEVFRKYCEVLEYVCEELKRKNAKLLCYSLQSVKAEWNGEEINNKDSLKQINNILANVYDEKKADDNVLYIISNIEDCKEVNGIQKKYRKIDVQQLDKENLEGINRGDKCKVLFLIDAQKEDCGEMLYLFGLIEGKLERQQLLGCFYNCENDSSKPICKKLFDRYANENNLDDRLSKFLQ